MTDPPTKDDWRILLKAFGIAAVIVFLCAVVAVGLLYLAFH